MKLFFRRCLPSILFLLCGIGAPAIYSQALIHGSVKNTDGMPIPGVNVQLAGTPLGTTTDFEGAFELVAQAEDTLVVSYMGYVPQQLPVGTQNEFEIILQEDEQSLGELVINAGYYTTTERERTGNIAKVTAEEIELQPVTNPLEALQGRMAGVEVVQATGIPGAAPSIQIRGQNSLRNRFGDNGNLPLYIVDGMPLNSSPIYSQNGFLSGIGTDPLSTLNLANIKRIEVLKDADATAIYGSRGANGVILITTKTGKAFSKKTSVTARVYSGISRVGHFVDLLDTQQYLRLRRQAFENDEATPTEVNAYDLLVWDQDRYTNWQQKLMGKTARLHQYNLSIAGGNETTNYRIGGGYQQQGSVFPGDFSYRKKTVHLSVNHHTKDRRFQLHFNTNYGIDQNRLFSSSTFVNSALSLPPNAPALYDEQGDLNWENSTWTNPLAALEGEGNIEAHHLISNFNLDYRLLKGLHLKANLGYTHFTSEEVVHQPISLYDPATWDRLSHRSQHVQALRNSWIAEPQLNYDVRFGDHEFNTLIGTTFQENTTHRLRLRGNGYAHRSFIGNLQAADDVSVSEDRELAYHYQAVYARLGYQFKQRYLLNLTARRDGSSRFGPQRRFANFGAVGAGWIISNEPWVKDRFNWLSFAKLRGSYGVTGSDQIGDYRYLEAYQTTPGPGGLYPTQLTNPNFSWELNRKLEGGLQLGFWSDRLHLNLSYYRNRSSQQLVGYPLPAITGFTSVEANLPATVENRGWEIEAQATLIQGQAFTWKTSINLSIPRNELLTFSGIEETAYQNTYRVGHPLNLAILYQYTGINQETGLYEVEDVNQDGVYSYEDRTAIRDLGRSYFGGLQQEFSYQGWSLNFLFEMVKQKAYQLYTTPPGFIGNILEAQLPVWQASGDGATTQLPSQGIPAILAHSNYYSSTGAIDDASFVRLKTLGLSYRLSPTALEALGLESCRLFLHGQNLFTLTSYVGLDPQMPGSTTLPALQSFSAGLEFTF